MTDQGAQRREARRFEPPPWEEQISGVAEEEPAAEPAVPPVAVPAPTTPERELARPEPAGIDQTRLDEMMFELRAEEPSASKAGWQLRLLVAAFLIVLGAVMMLWGMVALVKVMRSTAESRSLAMFVSGALLLFGAGFTGMGWWVGYEAYQKRGAR